MPPHLHWTASRVVVLLVDRQHEGLNDGDVIVTSVQRFYHCETNGLLFVRSLIFVKQCTTPPFLFLLLFLTCVYLSSSTRKCIISTLY